MNFQPKPWLRLSIINFMLVAVLGVLMRYKIAFSFPFLEQKHLQHSHSHFAFDGWVTQTLFVLMIAFLSERTAGFNFKKYRPLLVANLVAAYGMLVAFIFQGYGFLSISFATLSILIAFAFAFLFLSDIKRIPFHPANKWFKAAILFNVISAAGTAYLSYLMVNHVADQNKYLASVYFYLHFQYNGWFFFVCMGLIIQWLHKMAPALQINRWVFTLFFVSCIPAYFLSTLWANLPAWLYAITVLAAVCQFMAWIIFLLQVKKIWPQLKGSINYLGRLILLLVAVACSVKFVLQLGSTIPAIAKLAFGFRPVVIAYLHLILLAVFSLFLLGYSYILQFLDNSKGVSGAIDVIIAGVFLNELVLMAQGLAGFMYFPIPYVNEALFGIACLILFGIVMLLIAFSAKQDLKPAFKN